MGERDHGARAAIGRDDHPAWVARIGRGRSGAGGKVPAVATLLNIKTLDPGRTLENATNIVDHVTYDTLVTFEGEDLKTIRPSLATRWTASPDGLTYFRSIGSLQWADHRAGAASRRLCW